MNVETHCQFFRLPRVFGKLCIAKRAPGIPSGYSLLVLHCNEVCILGHAVSLLRKVTILLLTEEWKMPNL